MIRINKIVDNKCIAHIVCSFKIKLLITNTKLYTKDNKLVYKIITRTIVEKIKKTKYCLKILIFSLKNDSDIQSKDLKQDH